MRMGIGMGLSRRVWRLPSLAVGWAYVMDNGRYVKDGAAFVIVEI